MNRGEFLRLGLLSIVASGLKLQAPVDTIFDDKPQHYYHVFKVSSAMLNDLKAFEELWKNEFKKIKKKVSNYQIIEKRIGYTNDDFILDMFTVILKFEK